MVRRNLIGVAALALTAAVFNPAPPGTVAQNVTAYLSGEAMHSAWRVVTSRTAHQWYVSFYAPAATGTQLAYRLPDGKSEVLATVQKAPNADLYFPHQDVRIAGAAEVERTGVQDAVVQIHQIGADCGSAGVAVFGADAQMHVRLRAYVQNPCDLQAQIVKNGALSAVRLTGPYYAKNAALCCPTKAHVTALLSFTNAKWTVRPAYFALQTTRP